MNSEINNNLDRKNPAFASVVSSKKSNHILVIILAFLIVVSFGFAGFELWQNLRKDGRVTELENQLEDLNEFDYQKDNQIAELKKQINSLNNSNQVVSPDNSQGFSSARENPIITAVTPEYYTMLFQSGHFSDGNGTFSLNLTLRDGEISECSVYSIKTKRVENDVVTDKSFLKNCSINGIKGKIYKMVEVGKGHVSSGMGFIMYDGSVEYFSLADALLKSDFNMDGKLKIDGFVVDALYVAVGQEGAVGGYGATIFVLSDGSYIEYDKSMLE